MGGIEAKVDALPADRTTTALAEGAQVLDTASEFIDVGANILKRVMGEKVDAVLATGIMKSMRAMVYARLFAALVAPLSAGTASAEDLQQALTSSFQSQISRQIELGKEAHEANAGQIEQQFQYFLNQAEPYVKQIREQFANSPDPFMRRALRFAFANVFIPYDNIIAAQHLTTADNYDQRVAELLGAPAGLDDLLDEENKRAIPPDWLKDAQSHEMGDKVPLDDVNPDQTPKRMGIPALKKLAMSREHAQFKKNLFEIYHTDAFKALRQLTGDSDQLYFYEILGAPKYATPEELERAIKGILPEVVTLVNPKTLNFR